MECFSGWMFLHDLVPLLVVAGRHRRREIRSASDSFERFPRHDHIVLRDGHCRGPFMALYRC